jgi:hypothetical protein
MGLARFQLSDHFRANGRKTKEQLEADIASDPDAEIGDPTEVWVRVPLGHEVKLIKNRHDRVQGHSYLNGLELAPSLTAPRFSLRGLVDERRRVMLNPFT